MKDEQLKNIEEFTDPDTFLGETISRLRKEEEVSSRLKKLVEDFVKWTKDTNTVTPRVIKINEEASEVLNKYYTLKDNNRLGR